MELKGRIQINGGNMSIIGGVYLFVLNTVMKPKGPIEIKMRKNTSETYLVIFELMKFFNV